MLQIGRFLLHAGKLIEFLRRKDLAQADVVTSEDPFWESP